MSWLGGRSRRGRRRNGGGPPSAKAVGRLEGRVENEIGALREEFTDDLLLTMLLLDAGEVDEARGLVDSQSERLQRFQQRVDEAVAAAAVEREAEEVVLAATSRDARRRIPAPATAVLTATAGFLAVLAVLAGPNDDPDRVASEASERLAAERQQAVEAPTGLASEQRSPAAVGIIPERSLDGPRTAGETRSGLELLRLMGSPGRLLADLADSDETPLRVLLDVEELVRKLEPEIEQIRARAEASEDDSGSAEEAPQEEPSGERSEGEEEPPAVEPTPPAQPDDPDSGGSEEPSEDSGGSDDANGPLDVSGLS